MIGSVSVCFWAFWIRILPSTSKKWRKILISTVLWIFLWLFIFEECCNVLIIRAGSASGSGSQKYRRIRGSEVESHQDPYQNVTNPERSQDQKIPVTYCISDFCMIYGYRYCGESAPQGADPPPPTRSDGSKNNFNEEITPLLLTGIGERYC
jgi:hypothetical protein